MKIVLHFHFEKLSKYSLKKHRHSVIFLHVCACSCQLILAKILHFYKIISYIITKKLMSPWKCSKCSYVCSDLKNIFPEESCLGIKYSPLQCDIPRNEALCKLFLQLHHLYVHIDMVCSSLYISIMSKCNAIHPKNNSLPAIFMIIAFCKFFKNLDNADLEKQALGMLFR